MGTAKYNDAEAATPNPDVASEMEDAPTAVAVRGSTELGAFTGDAEDSATLAPYLQINSGRSTKPQAGSVGDLILDGDHLITPMGKPMTLIIASAAKYWKEYINPADWTPEVRPRTFTTAKEVIAAGGTTEWHGDEAPTFKRAISMRVLIKKPEDIKCMYFAIKFGGAEWAPAKWLLDKSAYERKSGKEGFGHDLTKAVTFALSGRVDLPENKRLLAGLWEVTVSKVKVGNFQVPVPHLKLVGQNDTAFIEEMTKAIGG